MFLTTFSIPDRPGFELTSRTYGSIFSLSLDGIKSTPVRIPPTALDALIDINANIEDPKSLGILDKLLEQIDKDPFIQKPLDDSRALQVRKEDKSLQRDLNKFLRGAVERNRQKFSKFDTFDDALDAAEQILEKQGGGQRKLFYDSDGNEQYVSFTEQAERLARLLFENQ